MVSMSSIAKTAQLQSDSVVEIRAPRNRTLTANSSEIEFLRSRLFKSNSIQGRNFVGRIIHGDCFSVLERLSPQLIDVLILDPPYNLNKKFASRAYSKMPVDQYTDWLRTLFRAVKPLLKSTATVYICGDWLSSVSIFTAASEFFLIQNRITWEREKGRGALGNWKNTSEDIWFCTASPNYTFNVDAVKIRRRVIAPYRKSDGKPKGWDKTDDGDFRDTHPSNLWTDITVPFWSMQENTDHPTQKSEKLIAKLILASSKPGDIIFDPFVGSGTSCVVAKKLGRQFVGIEQEEEYALLAEKRLELADTDQTIQGYDEGVFWERNTLSRLSSNKRISPSKRVCDSEKHQGVLLPLNELF